MANKPASIRADAGANNAQTGAGRGQKRYSSAPRKWRSASLGGAYDIEYSAPD